MPRDPRADWNRRYASGDRARAATSPPSAFLVAEVADLRPGRALDLACGAGRNAVWLAERSWRVTAVDFSAEALAMGRDLAGARGVAIEWIEADLTEWTPAPGAFDLVCVLYLQLPGPERGVVLGRARDALALGGTLLVLGHDPLNLTEGWGGPAQADVLFTPADVVAEVAGLQVDKAERVRRPVEDAAGRHEAIDALVRARRPDPGSAGTARGR